jgi:hypothetical protein
MPGGKDVMRMKSMDDLIRDGKRQIAELRKLNEDLQTGRGYRSYVKRQTAIGTWEDADVTGETIQRNEALIVTLEGLITAYGSG